MNSWLGRGCAGIIASLLLVLTAVSSTGHAFVDRSAATQEVANLREDLHQVTAQAHTRTLDYSVARSLVVGSLHATMADDGHYFLRDVYCQREFAMNGPNDKVGSVNVEHTWPQSHFFGGSDRFRMKSDLHHLFPAMSRINSERGNMKFGNVNEPLKPLSCTASRMGSAPDGSPRFEPPDIHKGNVARALFYFAVRYGGQIDADEEAALRAWNHLDPVDAAEMHRNDEIEKLQGNRNPFIDHPEYVDMISDF